MSDARMSVAEYRVWAETRPDHERWELLDGEPVLMSPPKARHQRIVTNLLGALDALARRKGCDTYPGLAILSAAMDDFAPIPDVVVHCAGRYPQMAMSTIPCSSRKCSHPRPSAMTEAANPTSIGALRACAAS